MGRATKGERQPELNLDTSVRGTQAEERPATTRASRATTL